MTTKPQERPRLPATLKPGDFAIGSAESRAAARILAEQRERVQAQQFPVNPGVERAKHGD